MLEHVKVGECELFVELVHLLAAQVPWFGGNRQASFHRAGSPTAFIADDDRSTVLNLRGSCCSLPAEMCSASQMYLSICLAFAM